MIQAHFCNMQFTEPDTNLLSLSAVPLVQRPLTLLPITAHASKIQSKGKSRAEKNHRKGKHSSNNCANTTKCTETKLSRRLFPFLSCLRVTQSIFSLEPVWLHRILCKKPISPSPCAFPCWDHTWRRRERTHRGTMG